MAEWKEHGAWHPIDLGHSPAPPLTNCVSEQATQPVGPYTMKTAMAAFHNFL